MTSEEKIYECANYLVENEAQIATEDNLLEIINDLREIITARDYSYIKPGAKLYWFDPARETSGMCTVEEVRSSGNDIEGDDIILISYSGGEAEVFPSELYKKTKEVCPRCGHRMFKSDLAHYKCVCLYCDENFG